MSVPPETLLALVVGLLLHPIPIGSHHGSNQRHLQKRLQEVFRRFSPLVMSHATLNHGEDCVSPYEEKLRQQIVDELRVIATSHATSIDRIKDTIDKMEEFISMNDKELCNYHLALVCDPDLRKCVCGPERVNVTFVLEDGKCHYAEGSMCSHNSKTECARATRCISISTLDECKSGLCFCQRQYYPTTNEPSTTTARPSEIIIDDFEDGDNDEETDEENKIPVSSKDVDDKNDVEEGESLEPIKSTKESYIPTNSFEDDDDDDGGGEEKVIVVKIDEVEKTVNGIGVAEPPSPDESESRNSWEVTTIPTPVATSPAPTRRQELTSSIRRLEQEVEAMKTLGLGDECFSITEESNYAEYRRLSSNMDCVTGMNDEENLTEILRKLELILESGSMMCNWTQHLECNGQSKKCECRTSSEILDGFYLLFMEEAKRCVLVENSRCLSQEHLSSRKSPFTEIPCASEAKCIAEETKAECKSKIENCFCRKPVMKPTEPPQKQKKSRAKSSSKTSAANSLSRVGHFININYHLIFYFFMMGFIMLLPRVVLIV